MCNNICVKPAEGYNLLQVLSRVLYAEAITLYFQSGYFLKGIDYNCFKYNKEW